MHNNAEDMKIHSKPGLI